MGNEAAAVKQAVENLRDKVAKRLRWQTEFPLIVYAVMFATLVFLWVFQDLHDDLMLGMFSEVLGAAFTLFIIDTLLVRSKNKRWSVVSNHVDYLIARQINRLRDGIATRLFGFRPSLNPRAHHDENNKAVRYQRAELLRELAILSPDQIEARLNKDEAFSEVTYRYLEEKADDIWELLNMKYSEFLAPELVSLLIELHTHLKDACAHIRQFHKRERFHDDEAHYHAVGSIGFATNLKFILVIVNKLKDAGYSDQSRVFG